MNVPDEPSPVPGGDVGHAGDLDARLDPLHPQGLTDDRVADVVDGVDSLQLGVLQEVVVDERAVDGDVAVAVDRRRDHER